MYNKRRYPMIGQQTRQDNTVLGRLNDIGEYSILAMFHQKAANLVLGLYKVALGTFAVCLGELE